ncbi:hypothetical protein ACFQZE_23655 [Paenibacillus sp. GCM10027627]|uniref:hypothetical protein n=1 Tax=unclassified Paenibacillus TaxID=185978 RepID=UPI00364473B9
MNENVWGISEFASLVGKHANTVDIWFKKLEEKELHYITRIKGEKVYDELDLKVARYIREKRSTSGKTAWALDAIFIELPEIMDLRPFPEGMTSAETQIFDYQGGLQEVLSREFHERDLRLAQLVDEVVAKRMQELFSSLKHQRVTESRQARKLREEALKSWQEQPAKVRFLRKGLFHKVENVEEKERYIKTFIDKYHEQNSE